MLSSTNTLKYGGMIFFFYIYIVGGFDSLFPYFFLLEFLFSRFHRKDVLDLEWSTDGSFLISGSVDNSCIIWDVNKGEKYYYYYLVNAQFKCLTDST